MLHELLNSKKKVPIGASVGPWHQSTSALVPVLLSDNEVFKVWSNAWCTTVVFEAAPSSPTTIRSRHAG